MSGITWLHLSDWHQKGKDFNRKIVRDALIRDIQNRMEIGDDLEQINFIVFSGDVANSGKKEEYETAIKELFSPLLRATGLTENSLFIVPGNHDIDEANFKFLPEDIKKPFPSEEKVQEWLDNDNERQHLLQPFGAYKEFVSNYTKQHSPDYASIKKLDVDGKKVALLGLNSALMCRRNRNEEGAVNDYGFLVVGEPQIYDALNHIADDDVRIVVLHHPFDWLTEFDRSRIEESLGQDCHFILQGHQHLAQIRLLKGTGGDCVVIPAGASYERRTANDPRYVNAYNFVHLDLETGQGKVYLRRWNDRRKKWIADTDICNTGQYGFREIHKKDDPMVKWVDRGFPQTTSANWEVA